MQVLKYRIPGSDRFELRIPEGGEILALTTDSNSGHVFIHVLVDEYRPNVTRQFIAMTTGSEGVQGNDVYVGSYRFYRHTYYVFEVREPKHADLTDKCACCNTDCDDCEYVSPHDPTGGKVVSVIFRSDSIEDDDEKEIAEYTQ